jgi:hypothetical protein
MRELDQDYVLRLDIKSSRIVQVLNESITFQVFFCVGAKLQVRKTSKE